jgi:hypothetical protein
LRAPIGAALAEPRRVLALACALLALSPTTLDLPGLSSLSYGLAASVDPPTLDELLEDADVEDRRRIERAIFSIDRSIEEIIALEDQLARKIQLLHPESVRDAIALDLGFAYEWTRSDGERGTELRVRVRAR